MSAGLWSWIGNREFWECPLGADHGSPPQHGQIPYGHSWENRSGDSQIWTCGRWEQRNSHIPQDSGQGVAFVGIVSSDFTGKEEFAPRRMLGLNVQGIFISMDCSCGRRSLEKVPRFLHILMENASLRNCGILWSINGCLSSPAGIQLHVSLDLPSSLLGAAQRTPAGKDWDAGSIPSHSQQNTSPGEISSPLHVFPIFSQAARKAVSVEKLDKVHPILSIPRNGLETPCPRCS